jgi:hypothetical protein
MPTRPADAVQISKPPDQAELTLINTLLAMAEESVGYARQRLNKVPDSGNRTRAERALDSALALLQAVNGGNAG